MSDGTRIPETREQQRARWRSLRDALRLRPTWSQLIVGVLCCLLGITIAVQVRYQDSDSLDGVSQQELLRLLDESGRHVSSLEQENAELDSTLETLRAGQEDQSAAQSAAEERLDDLELLAGTAPAHGRGLRIEISDPDGTLRASTLLGVVQELRNAGAEVIQLGDVRVVASTSITTGEAGGLMADGEPLPSSFEVLAIGDPSVMEPALRIPGGAADGVAADGGAFSAEPADDVRIEAIAPLEDPEHSQVVK